MPQFATGRSSRVAAGCLCLLAALTACGASQQTSSAVDSPASTRTASATATPKPTPAPTTPSSTPTPTATTPDVPDREPHTLVLKATGTKGITITSFKYTLDGKVEQEGKAPLPWRRSLSVPADGLPHNWSLEVEYTGSGTFQLFAIYDGEVKAQTRGQGNGPNVEGGGGIGGAVRG